MLKYYQNLLNECRALYNDKLRHKRMLDTLRIMQNNKLQIDMNILQSKIQHLQFQIKKANWIEFMKGV